MEWPSDRVKPGGIFQPSKVTFSPETKNYIKTLLDESKLTMMQRKNVNYSLRSGDPLPPLRKSTSSPGYKKPVILVRPGTSKRRSQDTIANSGAYEREKFVARFPKVDGEKAKKHLQDIMANGKKVANPRRSKPVKKTDEEDGPPENRFDQLVREIKDRKNWFKEMEELGEGERYKGVIELQVQEKLREMKLLKTASERKK